jgi:hypothetical protein
MLALHSVDKSQLMGFLAADPIDWTVSWHWEHLMYQTETVDKKSLHRDVSSCCCWPASQSVLVYGGAADKGGILATWDVRETYTLEWDLMSLSSLFNASSSSYNVLIRVCRSTVNGTFPSIFVF